MKHGKTIIYADASHDPEHEMNDLLDDVRHALEGGNVSAIHDRYVAADAVLNAFARTQIFSNAVAWKYRNRLNAVRNEIEERMKN